MTDKDKKWMKGLDWGRLIVALFGLMMIGMYLINPSGFPLNHMMSNVVALYVLLMGIKTHMMNVNRTLAWFYIFFSLMMLVSVNMIWFKFG